MQRRSMMTVLGHTLDWIVEHDPTTLFAGIALQAYAWVFQCFEDIDLLLIRGGLTPQAYVLRLKPLHRNALFLLELLYQHFYFLSS